MNQLLVGVVGVVIFVALVVLGTLFLGPQLRTMRLDSEAAQLLSQREQILTAYELRRMQSGSLANTYGPSSLEVLRDEGYLKEIPPGLRSDWWVVQDGVAMTVMGDDDEGLRMCVRARERMSMPNPQTVLACDDPGIDDRDPCCVVPA